jgi:lipopolysaccharide/colanic/teichoic acid biosynthesis glycosyltransferase
VLPQILNPASRERILIVGLPMARQILEAIDARQARRFNVVGVVDDVSPESPPIGVPLCGPLSRLAQIVEDVRPRRVLVGLGERRRCTPLGALVESCLARGIAVEDATEFHERLVGKLALETLAPASLIYAKRFGPSCTQRIAARLVSVVVAAAALVLFAPLLLLIAAAVKIDSRGPMLFVHTRIGAGGRPFKLLKFRTMRHGVRRSEWERDNRDQVTRIGRWLRAFRLDELPQFVNLLRGEMNLVGPRPHPLSNFELFTLVARNMNERTGTPVSYYALRTMVRPGMTGWAQVRYRYANDLDEEIEKLRYDLYYVKHMSLMLDLRIVLETVRVILFGHRAEAGAAAAMPAVPSPALALAGRMNPGQAA